MPDFTYELQGILELLNAQDVESQHLGYNILRHSDFKKFMRGKLFTQNNKSFYRFWLYKLREEPAIKNPFVNYHNQNKLNFAYHVVSQYLHGDIKIKKPKWQELIKRT